MTENSERGEKYFSNKKGRKRGKRGEKSREIDRTARKEVHKKAEEESCMKGREVDWDVRKEVQLQAEEEGSF